MALFRSYDDGLEMHVVDHGVHWQFMLMLGGERVSGLGLVKKRMRVGSAVVKMGGIAGVWTAGEHRRKGYASRGMDASVDFMREKGYETSILFGIRDFYHRYGFVEVFPGSALDVAAADLVSATSSLALRMGRKADLPVLSRLYNRHNRGRTGTVVRASNWDPAWRLPGFGPDTLRRPGKTLLACDSKARVRGYAVYDVQQGRCQVSEIVAVNGAARGALARGLGQRARRGASERVTFQLPPGDPFIQFCQRFGGRFRINHLGDGGSMGRIVDLKRLMDRLSDELAQRWRQSGVPWGRPVALETDIGSVTLTGSRTGVDVTEGVAGGSLRVQMPQEALTLLVMGARRPEQVAADRGVVITDGALPVLQALFPTGNAYVWWPDRF